MDHVLWEDLDNACVRVQTILTALQSLEHAIQAGLVGLPTRQDSKHLNRLTVLADLLYAEIRPWTDELVPAARPDGNGHLPAH